MFLRNQLTSSTGVDDILCMLLALVARPDEIEVMLLSITYGNVEVQRFTLSTLLPVL